MANYFDGKDAVFLPGKIHGAEHQFYISSKKWCLKEPENLYDFLIDECE